MSARMGTGCLLGIMVAFGMWNCGASGQRTSSINESAAIAGSLPWNPLQWKVITSSVDRQASTMSTLYGNDAAVQYARGNSENEYPAGSVLALVTWTRQADAHWFGAAIPGQVKSVEFVSMAADSNGQRSYSYASYQGSPLVQTAALSGRSAGSRTAYLVSLRAAVMP